ncbi:MAG: ECF transporter S component [Butyricicoccus sp.]|nr:ECF transporter S component [Butyricicoccus sp.]
MQNTNGANTAGRSARKANVRSLVMAALMGVLSFILMYFNFPVPILSPFAELDASALPEIIGGFILGPACALEIIIVKIALILIFKGSSSFFTGEVQNFLLSVSYVLPAILYYRKHRTKKGAAIGLVIGSAASVVVAVFTNLYIIFPAYIYLIGMTWDDIIGIFHEVNPYITNLPTIAAFSVVPFNLVSRAATSLITMLLYKKISVPIKKFIS